MADTGCRWLLLIHQIPPTPAYLRVKVGRRLQSLGALPIKNSVYVLPNGAQSLEDFQWVRREILAGGGEGTVCEGRFVEGHTDDGLVQLFVAAREADYAALREQATALERAAFPARKKAQATLPDEARAQLVRLRRQLAAVQRVDFFEAAGGRALETVLDGIEARLRPRPPERAARRSDDGDWKGLVWVTRTGVQVDRIASAWLIRRFVEPGARLKFVDGDAYTPEKGEVRFDMFEGEFTHDGDLCTFEVLARHFAPDDAALAQLGEIVHDVDLKDAKFDRAEAAGLERMLAGLTRRERADEARIAQGSVLFDALYSAFRRPR